MATFLTSTTDEARPTFETVDERELEARLRQSYARACEVPPDLDVTLEDYVQHVAPRVRSPDALDQLEASDLLLVLACLRACRIAIAEFERRFVPEIRRGLKAGPSDDPEDALQELKTSLLVSQPDKPARLWSYSGRGPLLHWIRVVTTRMSIDARRGHQRAQRKAIGAEDLELLAPLEVSVDDAYLRQRYAPIIKRALETALLEIDATLRILLRQRLVDGLSLREIARLHDMEHKKVGRWVESARQRVWERFCQEIDQDASIGARELESLIRRVRGELDLSISRLLS